MQTLWGAEPLTCNEPHPAYLTLASWGGRRGTRRFVARSNAYASSMSRGSPQDGSEPTPNGAG